MRAYKPNGDAIKRGDPSAEQAAHLAVQMSLDAIKTMKEPVVVIHVGGDVFVTERQTCYANQIESTFTDSETRRIFDKKDRIIAAVIEDLKMTHIFALHFPTVSTERTK